MRPEYTSPSLWLPVAAMFCVVVVVDSGARVPSATPANRGLMAPSAVAVPPQALGGADGGGNVKVRNCEPINVPMCQQILGYNVTASPNLVGHETQSEASDQLKTFQPLLQYGCSRRLLFFLCSTYVPMCTEKVHQLIGPCRPLCESVRSKCEPVLNQFGFPWLPILNCTRFPPRNDANNMCMDGPEVDDEDDVSGKRPPSPRTAAARGASGVGSTLSTSGIVAVSSRAAVGPCSEMRKAELYVYVNRTRKCLLRCSGNDAFSENEKRFAEAWITLWTVLCFISTLFALISCLIHSSRFCYPQRLIIIISFCYNVTSIGHVMRLLAGRQAVACRFIGGYSSSTSSAAPSSVPDQQIQESVLSDEGIGSTDCTVVFLLIYYFSVASCVWWVLLTVTWFLMAGLGWTRDVIDRRTTILHVVGWSVPAMLTICVLVIRAVDADELTGLCYVGHQDASSLLTLVIVPLTVCLVLALAFLAASVVSLYRSESNSRRRHRPSPSGSAVSGGSDSPSDVTTVNVCEMLRERDLVRVGLFAVVYVVPMSCLLGCYCYEFVSRESWYRAAGGGAGEGGEEEVQRQPNTAALMLKASASLFVGVTCGLWICGARTFNSWRNLYNRLIHCCCHRDCTGTDKRRKVALVSSSSSAAAAGLLRQGAPLKSVQLRQQTGGGGQCNGIGSLFRQNDKPLSHHFHQHHHHHHHHQLRQPVTQQEQRHCSSPTGADCSYSCSCKTADNLSTSNRLAFSYRGTGTTIL